MSDERVERVARVLRPITDYWVRTDNSGEWLDTAATRFLDELARAAIDALDDEPPLEDVLRDLLPTQELILRKSKIFGLGYYAKVRQWENGTPIVVSDEGGDTLAEAIRAAVANAQEGE